MTGKFIVIHATKFAEYQVRKVKSRTKLVLAWCQRSGVEWFAANIIISTQNEHNLLHLIKLAKEMNLDMEKKLLTTDRQSGSI